MPVSITLAYVLTCHIFSHLTICFPCVWFYSYPDDQGSISLMYLGGKIAPTLVHLVLATRDPKSQSNGTLFPEGPVAHT